MAKISLKVTDAQRRRRFGVVVSGVAELLRRARTLLSSLSDASDLCVHKEDGTAVDDDGFLLALEPHTLLIVSSRSERSQQVSQLKDVVERYLQAAEELQAFRLEEINQFILNSGGQRLEAAIRLVQSLSSNQTHLSSRQEHPEWFEGCNKLVTTKEDYFRRCARRRVQSYLRDASSVATPSSSDVVRYLKRRLEQRRYFGCYFDRSAPDDDPNRLCDAQGAFRCAGRYDRNECESQSGHRINPYDSAESRVLFATWNLDHVVERRTILRYLEQAPSHGRCVESCHEQYFELLFTLRNLKLVHKNCHVIGAHEHRTPVIVHRH